MDEIIAVAAMLVSIRPILRGVMNSSSQVSWPRLLALLAGALAACSWTVGLLALRSYVLTDQPFLLPNELGIALAGFGGALGVSSLLAQRGEDGMTEQAAIRWATQAVAMALYVAAPVLAAGALGLTRLTRATLPWTLVRTRWRGTVEGLVLLAVCIAYLLSPESTWGILSLGGLRTPGALHLPL